MTSLVGVGLAFFVGSYFVQRVGARSSRTAKVPMWLGWLLGSPRRGRVDEEMMVIQLASLGFVFLVFVLFLTGQNSASRLPILALYGAGAFVIIIGAAARFEWRNRRELASAMNDYVVPLLSRYGLARTKDKHGDIVFESSSTSVRFELFPWNLILVWLEPRSLESSGQALWRPAELSFIAHYRTGAQGDDFVFNLTRLEITEAIQKAAKLLEQYCTPMLQGDWREWAEIQTFAEQSRASKRKPR